MKELLPLWIFLLVLYLLFFAFEVKANPYDYRVLRVIDGDTVEFEAPFLPEPFKQKLSLRIYGVDTPEKGGNAKCTEENMKSLAAKLFVEQEIMNATTTKIYLMEWDKYGGRVIGDVILDGEYLSVKLIKNGHAKEYYGHGPKINWCQK
jgi:endonuclease YncB( thermonuclease family)